MNSRAVVAVACALVGASVCVAEPVRLSERDGYGALVERWAGLAETMGLEGYAIALVRDGELFGAEGFGTRDCERGEPVDADTMFYIASCTKTYVAAAIVKLADEGKIDLDAPLRRYLPEFALADEAIARAVTPRDLLGHSTGIRSSNAVFLDAYTGAITDARYFHWLAGETPSGEITYTNIHYTLLGRVIERVTGESWRDYLDSHMFTPAGMHRTTGYASEMYTDPNAAFPHVWRATGPERADVVKSDEVMHAAGGLGTSAIDGARWIMLQMHEGELDGARVYSREAAQEMLREQSRFDSTKGSVRAMDGFAGGWQMGTWRGGPRYYQHGGGYIGTAAHLSFIPDKGLGVVVLANTSPEGNAFADVVSIDFYDHELETENPGDFLQPYAERVQRLHSRAEEALLPRLTSEQLSLPARRYVGSYYNEWLGRIDVSFDRGELVARMGNFSFSMHAAEDGAVDAFRLVASGTTACRFVVRDEVAALEMIDEETGTDRFDRVPDPRVR